MTLTFDTTPEQDAALDALNQKSNGTKPPPVGVFALSVITDFFDSLIASGKRSDVSAQVIVLQSAGEKVSDQDLAALKAIAAKYDNVQAQATITATP